MRSKSEEYPSNAVWVSEPHQAQTSRVQGIICWLTFGVHPIQISSIDYILKLISNVQGFNQGWRSPNLCRRILPFVSHFLRTTQQLMEFLHILAMVHGQRRGIWARRIMQADQHRICDLCPGTWIWTLKVLVCKGRFPVSMFISMHFFGV